MRRGPWACAIVVAVIVAAATTTNVAASGGSGGNTILSAAALWSWQETVVDATNTACRARIDRVLGGDRSAGVFAGGAMHLSTGRMFLCDDSDAQRRRGNLPAFHRYMQSNQSMAVNWLFGQRKQLKNATAINAWVAEALAQINTMRANGLSDLVPAELHFDVEYEATAADALRVVNMAASVRKQLDAAAAAMGAGAAGGATLPLIVWAVDTASMTDLPTSHIACPADGSVTLIAKCMLGHYVDRLTIMDYRSFAVTECLKPNCDGAAVLAAPFFAFAASIGKQVAIAAETSCGLGTYTYKISFCADTIATGCPPAAADPLSYLYTTLGNVSAALQDVPATTTSFPCAAPAMPAGAKDLWTGNVPASGAFVIEDLDAFSTLAYGQGVEDVCPYAGDWDAC